MANSKETTKNEVEKAIIDIADFFTKDKEKEGVWTKVNVFGKDLFEFKIIGSNSDKVTILNEEFNKKSSEIAAIVNPEERAEKLGELYAESAAKRILEMRPIEGTELKLGGKPVDCSKETIVSILKNSYDIAAFVIRFSMNSGNFTNKKIN